MADLRSAGYSPNTLKLMDENEEKKNMLFPMGECDNLDSLNDETFGSESFSTEWDDSDVTDSKVEEFERWKKEQKNLTMTIPLDEAPARDIQPDEEKMAQAISKLNSIEFESPKEDHDEDPLPNAHAIEALWPTSPKHSSNIATPSSPYLQDLLSPTHNIWGSPTSEEKKIFNESDDFQHKQQLYTKQEESRESFSPVLEDEAIVSALPKRVPKASRVDDLKNIGFGSPVNPQPMLQRPTVNGLPKIRPPPGLSPNPNMGPFPVRPNLYGMYQAPGQRGMTPAQAHAYYAALMKQRMAYASPYCHTPPPTSAQQFPRPFYHSDPAHLRHRAPNMAIPRHHARFITPQPRNWNNNSRGGRSHDNRRRPQHYSEPPKYRPQFYVESEDEEEEEEGALMTAKEKDWLIRIQLMQLTTDKPELDDYYFHTYERRRLAKERASRQAGVERDIQQPDKNAEMSLPHVTKGESQYKPAKFEGSLGQVSVGSVFHPREVVQVGNSGRPKGPVGSLKETKKKYQLLLTIEKGFDHILRIEDLERMAFQMPQDVRPQLYERRERLFQRCYDLLGLKPSKDTNKKYDDDTLLQMISVRKGRRLLSKMLLILKEVHRHEISLAITRNLRVLTKKDSHNEEKDNLCEALLDVIKGSSSQKLVEHYAHAVGEQDGSVLQLFNSKFTLRIVIEMMKRMAELANNIDEDSLPLQSLWPNFISLAIRDFVTVSPKVLAKNIQEVGSLVDLLNNNADSSKLAIIQEHYRLVENARLTSPTR